MNKSNGRIRRKGNESWPSERQPKFSMSGSLAVATIMWMGAIARCKRPEGLGKSPSGGWLKARGGEGRLGRERGAAPRRLRP